MSTTLFDLEAFLSLNSKKYTDGLNQAEKDANSTSSVISKSFGGVSKTITGIVKTIAALQIGKKLIGFGKDTIAAASSFESAFTGVKKTVDATAEEYETLSDWIMEASTKMAASKEDIAGTMEIAGQLGIRGIEGLEKFTETMVMLGDTTNLSAEEAAGALARFSNITGISAEDADKIGSVIVDLGNNFATTEQDIVAMATRLAGAGTQFGLSGAEILGFATALSSVGIQAEMGGSAFSKAMIKMQVAAETGYDRVNDLEKKTGHTLRELELMASNDSAGFKMLAQSLGMTTKEVNEIIKSGNELNDFAKVAGMTRDEFVTAFRDDSTAALQAFIQGLGNTDAAGESTIQMLQDMGFTEVRLRDTLTRLAGSNDLITNSVNMANKAFEENVALVNEATLRYSTTESQAMQTAESFKNLKVIMGQELLPVYGQVMSFSQEAMKAMTEGLQTGGLSGFMSSVGTAFSQALTKITEAIPTVVSAGASLVSALGQGIIDNLPVFLQTGVQIVSQLAGYVTQAAPTLIPAAVQLISDLSIDIIEQLPTLIGLGVQLIGSIAEGLMAAIPVLLEKAPEVIEALAQALIDAATNISPTIGKIFDFLFGWMTEHGEVVLAIITGIGTAFAAFKVVGTIATIFTTLTTVFTNLIPIIKTVFSLVTGFITANPVGIIVAAIAGLIAIIVTLYNTNEDFRNKVNEIWGNIKNFFSNTIENIKEKFGQFKEKITELKDHAKEKFSEMKDNVGEKMDAMGQKIGEVWDAILANPVVQAIFTYVKDTFENLKNTLFGVWNGIKDEVIGAWEFIKNTVLGIVLLLCDLVTGDFENLKNDALNIWGNMWSGIKQFFAGIWEVLVSLFQGFINTFINLFVFLRDSVWKMLVDFKDAMIKLGKVVEKGVTDFFKNVGKKVSDFFENIGMWVINSVENLVKGVINWLFKIPETVEEGANEAAKILSDLPAKALQWGKDLIDNFVNGIKSVVGKVGDAISGVAQGIRDFLGFSEPKKGPLHVFHTFAPDMIDLFVKGIKDNQEYLQNAVADAFDFESLITSPTVNSTGQNGANRGLVGNNYTINVNQPVSTPADMLREIRTQAQYGLMIGEALV